jgi:hypothetical protein
VVGGLAGGLLFAVIGGVGAFLVSAFVTGGALTLLDIGDSLHRLVEIEEKRDAESAPRQQLLTQRFRPSLLLLQSRLPHQLRQLGDIRHNPPRV